ncbi:prepilin-type N-terminal cleavage/methylation domain-containing protein [bacterium]|nr:prepilin-type N-terminal cleavage/methylation domain-containing protein [bacterium]
MAPHTPWSVVRRKAFSLVEVLVALTLLTFMAFTVIAGLQFSARLSRLNANATVAKNIAQGYLERMMIDDFDHVDATHYPDIGFDHDPPVYIDQALDIRCQVTFQFKGAGTLTNASANNLTDNNIHWTAHEWDGDTVFLVAGDGAGQMGQIDNNTVNTLHLAESLTYPPSKGTQYLINNGKTVEITTTWRYLGKDYQQTVETLIVKNKRNPGL